MSLQRRQLLVATTLICGLASGLAQSPLASQAKPPPEVASEWPTARLQGGGRMRFLGLRIYDARLWVASGGIGAADASWAGELFALELEYARELSGQKIADRSLVEMKRQGDISADTAQRWLATMIQLFPDVKPGDRITGVNLPGKGARFFVNGLLRGEAADAEFARRFFGIWLSPLGSEPALRKALLGLAP